MGSSRMRLFSRSCNSSSSTPGCKRSGALCIERSPSKRVDAGQADHCHHARGQRCLRGAPGRRALAIVAHEYGYVILFAMTLGIYSIVPSIYLWREVSKPLSVILFAFFALLGWVCGMVF